MDPVLLGVNLEKSHLAKYQVGEAIALEKGGGQILGKPEERHPFCCLFVLNLRKPFDDGTQQQPIRVLVEHYELYR